MSNTGLFNKVKPYESTADACGHLGYVIDKLPQVLETMRKAQALLASSSDFITASCTSDVGFAADELQFCLEIINRSCVTVRRDVDESMFLAITNGEIQK